MTVGDPLYSNVEIPFYFAVYYWLHKTQYTGSRVVYDFFALLSDVGGFMSSIKLIVGGAISFLYLPKLFEADFIKK